MEPFYRDKLLQARTAAPEPQLTRPDNPDPSSAQPEPIAARPESTTSASAMPDMGRVPIAPVRGGITPAGERRAAYRQWLEERSKDDLIELLMGVGDHATVIEHTSSFLTKPRLDVAASDVHPESYRIPDDLAYARLPAHQEAAGPSLTWRIALFALDHAGQPIGVQLSGEITIGRAAGETSPDLDLTRLGAQDKGVSRSHARLRPDLHHLILMDNGSSNGTYLNGVRLLPYTNQALKDGDVVTLGRMRLLVKIVKRPSGMQTKTLL